MKKENTLFELLVGIVFFGIVMQIICVCVSRNYWYDAVGIWSGIAISCFSAIHMKRTIEDAIDLGESGAVKHIRLGYVKRMLVAFLVVGIVLYFKVGNPLTVLISIFSLKMAAYLQPLVHKIISKMKEKGKEN